MKVGWATHSLYASSGQKAEDTKIEINCKQDIQWHTMAIYH